MIFRGRGRSTTSANGSSQSQVSATSSGRVCEHQGGVSLRQDVKHHGGASLCEDTEDTECAEHQGGASLVDNRNNEGGVSLQNDNNEPIKDNKQCGVNVSTSKISAEAIATSVNANAGFSQRQKATLVSNHSTANARNKQAPVKPHGFNMATHAYNSINKGFGHRAPLVSQYVDVQRQNARLVQSNSAPVLPMIVSPSQSSMDNPGPMNGTIPAPQMGGNPTAQYVQPGNAHATPFGSHVYHHPVVQNHFVVQSPTFSHVIPVSNSYVHSNVSHNSNVGPVPASNGPHGHSTHGNYHMGHNSGMATASGNYAARNNNVGTSQGGFHVGYNKSVVIPNNVVEAPHGNHLAHSSTTGMATQNNLAAPTPTHADKQVKYFVNPYTGDKMTLDGTIWTPHGEKKDIFADASNYNQTEPRNFAPRPIGSPIMFPPPSTFDSISGPNNQTAEIVSSMSIYDPFLSPTSSAVNDVNRAAVSQADSQELACNEATENEEEMARKWGLLRHKLPMLRKQGSDGLKRLVGSYNGVPSEGVLLSIDNFPFIEGSSQSMPVTWGVIKLSNIPFGTLRAEIIALLGRNSRILNDAQEPVHIIMERVTSKTGDAYVEFLTQGAAQRAFDRHNEAIRKHRHPRLGDRSVEMTISSQKELMEALFPWCRGVRFNNGHVEMLPFDEENPWNVFRGFVTEEEMNLVIKNVEVPSRSPYSKDCPQRPFESMISTLKKVPWYRSDVITLKQRQILYDATCRLLELLSETISKEDRPVNNRRQENVLNEQLYKRLVNAAMLCPGFSVLQKDNIAYIAGLTGARISQFNMPPFADCWGHLYNLCPRPGVPVDVLEWYIGLIREETVRFVSTLPQEEQVAIKERAKEDTLYFGYMWYEIQLPQGKELADMTLREVAKKELEAMKRALHRAATLAHNPKTIEGAS